MIIQLNHVNLRTAQLEAMIEWYGRVLDMHPGPRPDFSNSGAWLYAGGQAMIHLVADPRIDGPGGANLALEHFALSAQGYAGFITRLEGQDIAYKIARVPPGLVDIVQVNIHDPDGNHIHVDFSGEDAGV